MTTVEPSTSAESVGKRRKGLKTLPKLPLHIFSPPNSGSADKFPLPPSPSAVHPSKVVDAHVLVKSKEEAEGKALERWLGEIAERGIKEKIEGVVVSVQGVEEGDVEEAVERIRSVATSAPAPIISIGVPYPLENGPPGSAPANYALDTRPPVHFITTLTQTSQEHAKGVHWALQQGRVVEVDVQLNLVDGEAGWEALEDFLLEALGPIEQRKGTLILSSFLPPPHLLSTPIVRLLSHPSYTTFQARIASLSLFPNSYIKLLPPNWNAPTPQSPGPSGSSKPSAEEQEKEAKEWKRRIKMYLGPAVEAFGYQRILFGTSPPLASTAPSNAGDWYELARESFAELGLEQEDIDAVFCNNAKKAYSAKP